MEDRLCLRRAAAVAGRGQGAPVSHLHHCAQPAVAVAYGLGKPADYFYEMRKELARSRDRLTRGLESIGFPVLKSQGTYFLTVDLSPLGLNETDVAFCKRIVTDYKVAAIPVSAFYEKDAVTSVVRFCFSKNDATLDTALERLSDAVRGREGSRDAPPNRSHFRFVGAVAASALFRCRRKLSSAPSISTTGRTIWRRGAGGFTRETGIKVVYDTFDANETLETRLLAGNPATTSSFPPAISCSARSPRKFS